MVYKHVPMIHDLCQVCEEVKDLVSTGPYKNRYCETCALDEQEEALAKARVNERERQQGTGV
jgi:hypothetical protein